MSFLSRFFLVVRKKEVLQLAFHLVSRSLQLLLQPLGRAFLPLFHFAADLVRRSSGTEAAVAQVATEMLQLQCLNVYVGLLVFLRGFLSPL